jgi:protein TonB
MQIDLNDIIFAQKNREYGAFVLRKYYHKFLSYATIAALVFFVLSVSTPLIVAYLKPKAVVEKKKAKIIDYTQLAEPPSIEKKQQEIVKVDEPPPLKSTVQFLPPVVKADELVKEEFIPSQEELKEVDPGAKTQKGDSLQGIDFSTREIEEKPEEKQIDETVEEKPEIFTFAEEMPSYPGGDEALYAFVTANIEYPEIAKRAGVEGKVFVSFVVTKDGSLSTIRVEKGIGGGCDEEAVSVIRKMPRWTPGKQNGRPVYVKVIVPILFKLQ